MPLKSALEDLVETTLAAVAGLVRKIEYVASLPRTETGKLQRFALRRLVGEGADHKLAS